METAPPRRWLVFDCPLHGGGTIVERFLAT
jgi:hypothetical protein